MFKKKKSYYPELDVDTDCIVECSEESSEDNALFYDDKSNNWIKKISTCVNFKNLTWFMILICTLTVAQESTQVYFNRTAYFWQKEYGFSADITDWIISANALFQMIFTIILVHISLKYHRVFWTAVSVVAFAVSCLALTIPEFIYPFQFTEGKSLKEYTETQQLYQSSSNYYISHDSVQDETPISLKEMSWFSFSIMLTFQITLGVSASLLFVHGMVFIDDHGDMEDSIPLIGIFLAFKQMGPYIGTGLTWLTIMCQKNYIFLTTEWIVLCAVIFVLGILFGTYPEFLSLKIRTKSAVCSLDSALNKKDLFSFLTRIVKNKIVFINMICSFCFWCAITNFFYMGNNLNKAKFSLPDMDIFENPKYFQVIIYGLTPFMVFAIILFVVSVITKYDLKAFDLALCNAIIPAMLVLVFSVYMYLNCEKPKFSGKIMADTFCDWNSNCDQSLYEPICITDLQTTYFSPCYAGCQDVSYDKGYLVFGNCTCATPYDISFNAYPGICSMESCYPNWVAQDLIQLTIVTLSSVALVCHMITTLYCVHFSERPYAIALHITMFSLREFGLIRSAFKNLASESCRVSSSESTCLLHDPIVLTRFVLTLVIAFLILSSLSGLLLAMLIRHRTCYSRDVLMTLPEGRWKRQTHQKSQPCYFKTIVEVVPMMIGSSMGSTRTAQIHDLEEIPTMVTIEDGSYEFSEIWHGGRICLSIENIEDSDKGAFIEEITD